MLSLQDVVSKDACDVQLFFTPLSQALRLVMHLGEPLPEERLQNVEFNTGTLVLFYLLPFMMMMWTNGIGASTGMFVPALAVGATGRAAMIPQTLYLQVSIIVIISPTPFPMTESYYMSSRGLGGSIKVCHF